MRWIFRGSQSLRDRFRSPPSVAEQDLLRDGAVQPAKHRAGFAATEGPAVDGGDRQHFLGGRRQPHFVGGHRGGTGRTTSGVPELCALSSGSITSTFSALIAGAVNGEPVPGDVEREFRHRPAGGERLLRYCARPPFALERLQQRDAEHLLYAASKPGPGGSRPQLLTPLHLVTWA